LMNNSNSGISIAFLNIIKLELIYLEFEVELKFATKII